MHQDRVTKKSGRVTPRKTDRSRDDKVSQFQIFHESILNSSETKTQQLTDQFYTQRTVERHDPAYQKTMESLLKQNEIYNTSPSPMNKAKMN